MAQASSLPTAPAEAELTGEEKTIRRLREKFRNWREERAYNKQRAEALRRLKGDRKVNGVPVKEIALMDLCEPRPQSWHPEPGTLLGETQTQSQYNAIRNSVPNDWTPEHASFASNQRHSHSRPSSMPYPPRSGSRAASMYPSISNASVDSILAAYTRGYEDGKMKVLAEHNAALNATGQGKGKAKEGIDSSATTVANGGHASHVGEASSSSSSSRLPTQSGLSAQQRLRSGSTATTRTQVMSMEERVIEKRGMSMGWNNAWKVITEQGWTQGCVYCSQKKRKEVMYRRSTGTGVAGPMRMRL